jgi:hypothetical protein
MVLREMPPRTLRASWMEYSERSCMCPSNSRMHEKPANYRQLTIIAVGSSISVSVGRVPTKASRNFGGICPILENVEMDGGGVVRVMGWFDPKTAPSAIIPAVQPQSKRPQKTPRGRNRLAISSNTNATTNKPWSIMSRRRRESAHSARQSDSYLATRIHHSSVAHL